MDSVSKNCIAHGFLITFIYYDRKALLRSFRSFIHLASQTPSMSGVRMSAAQIPAAEEDSAGDSDTSFGVFSAEEVLARENLFVSRVRGSHSSLRHLASARSSKTGKSVGREVRKCDFHTFELRALAKRRNEE